ncbi:MAG: GGDEF domain-containing protein [Elusimicrobia bacterium]|nr:GGDEF domain-containing protein [Elusimicrobiota bacterium]
MLSYRDVTLFGSNAIFLACAGALYLYPDWAIVIFPLFSLIYFWSDFRRDAEIQVIFMFLATAVAIVLMALYRDGPTRAALGLELGGVWLLCLGLGLHRRRLEATRQSVQAKVQEREGQLRDLDRDLRFYGSFQTTAARQIQLRRDVTQAAKRLGTTLDPKEAQNRLIKTVQERYPGSRARVLPGEPHDALSQWSANTRASVLVKDVASDERFQGKSPWTFRSAIQAPLLVVKRPFGFLRLESDAPGAFSADDLRTVDLFATLTSLTLENIHFFDTVNELATHDALTGLSTHKAFQNRLGEEVLRGGRSQTPLALVMCDVDHFKLYNDTYGHQAGDLLLQKVARILSNHARPVDFVARYGGEEFALLLPGVVREQAVEFAAGVRGKVADEPFVFQGKPTKVTMSFGVSAFPQDATTPSQLVRAADQRLYTAKTSGRNRVIG